MGWDHWSSVFQEPIQIRFSGTTQTQTQTQTWIRNHRTTWLWQRPGGWRQQWKRRRTTSPRDHCRRRRWSRLLLLLLRVSPSLSFLYYFKKCLLFPGFDFFLFFGFHFLGLGIWFSGLIFWVFDFLGLGICSGFDFF